MGPSGKGSELKMDNIFFNDLKLGHERKMFFHYIDLKDFLDSFEEPKEMSYCYSPKKSIFEIKSIIESFIKSDGLTEKLILIDFGIAVKNPKDRPNRRLSSRLARFRMKFKPISVGYSIKYIKIEDGVTSIYLSALDSLSAKYNQHIPEEIIISMNNQNKFRISINPLSEYNI